MRSSSEALRAFLAGWRRVIGAPVSVVGVWLAITLTALPAALTVHQAIADHLGRSLTAVRVAAGADLGWWQEFLAQARGAASTLVPAIIGAAAPLGNWSGFLDHPGVPPSLLATVAASLAAWMFLGGGLIDRFARGRRVGSRAFFGTCGVFFFRFLRLGVMVGALYWLLAGPWHALLFDGIYPWVTRDLSAERVAFRWRVVLYAVWLLPLVALNLVADYAKVRAVVEDRRSMIGALASAIRFLARRPGQAISVYVANALALGVLFALYLLFAPGARGGDWRLIAVLVAGQAWILARIVTRLAFLSTSAALLQQSLAHAEYTAGPLPVWPDSPAAEAIENAARFGVRPEL